MARFASHDKNNMPEPAGEVTLYIGESKQYTFSFTDYLTRLGLTMADITWLSSNAGVLEISNASPAGGVLTWNAKGLKQGETNFIVQLVTTDAARSPKEVIKFYVHDAKAI